MPTNKRAAEARIRRAAKRISLQVVKSRWRLGSLDNCGGYQVVDPSYNMVLHGGRFELTVDEVAHWLAVYAHEQELPGLAASMNRICGECPKGCHVPKDQEPTQDEPAGKKQVTVYKIIHSIDDVTDELLDNLTKAIMEARAIRSAARRPAGRGPSHERSGTEMSG